MALDDDQPLSGAQFADDEWRGCSFCVGGASIPLSSGTMRRVYRHNFQGGYGMPEMWACRDCAITKHEFILARWQ